MKTGWAKLAVVVLGVLLLTSTAIEGAGLPPKPAKLTMAVVAGGETKGLKAILPMGEREMGVKVELVEFPYPTLYEKLLTAFQANASTCGLLIGDDPWMPKCGPDAWLVPLYSSFASTRDRDIFLVAA